MQAKQKPSSAGEQTAPGCRGEKMGRRGGAAQGCFGAAEPNQIPRVWVPWGPLQGRIRSLPTALPSAGQRGAQQHGHAFVPPLSFLPPDFSSASSLLCVHHPLPAHSSCLVFLPLSKYVLLTLLLRCCSPHQHCLPESPAVAPCFPTCPRLTFCLPFSDSLGESVCVNARIPLFIG